MNSPDTSGTGPWSSNTAPAGLPRPYSMLTTLWNETHAEGLLASPDGLSCWHMPANSSSVEIYPLETGQQDTFEKHLDRLAETIGTTRHMLWTSTHSIPPPASRELPQALADEVARICRSASPEAQLDLEPSIREFSPFVQENIRYYVYLLQDPRDGEVFYVGKGRGNRVFSHASADLADSDATEKLDRIRAILNAGLRPHAMLLRFELDERTALHVESAAIQLLGLDSLTNRAHGHHISRGLMSVDVAASIYEAAEAPPIEEPVLLIRIPRLWDPAMDPCDLYEATRGWWRVGPRRERATYAMAVSRGVVREVFRIKSWRQRTRGDRDWEDDTGEKPRWGFTGHPAEEMAHYRNKDVSRYFKPGAANPIRYLNC